MGAERTGRTRHRVALIGIWPCRKLALIHQHEIRHPSTLHYLDAPMTGMEAMPCSAWAEWVDTQPEHMLLTPSPEDKDSTS